MGKSQQNYHWKDTEKNISGLDSTESSSIPSISQMFLKDMVRNWNGSQKNQEAKNRMENQWFWRKVWRKNEEQHDYKSKERLLNRIEILKKQLCINAHRWLIKRLVKSLCAVVVFSAYEEFLDCLGAKLLAWANEGDGVC